MKEVYKIPMSKTFVKMHGLGNDFSVFDGRAQDFQVPLEKIRDMADRRTGIGFDQMIIVDSAKTPGTDFFMRIYNADGSEVEACGNATRCVAKLLIKELKKPAVVLETGAAVLKAEMIENNVSVDMGKAHLEWKEIPLSREENTLSLPVSTEGLKNPVAVNIGNPHAVFFVQDADNVDLEAVGPEIENHSLFP